MQLTDRYVADELEPLFGSWQVATGRDLRLDRPVVLAATKDASAHRSQLDHWLGKRAPLSHPFVAPLLDCAEGEEWYVCVFEGAGSTPGLPDLPLQQLFQACLRITDGAEELLRARVPFVFSAGQVLFDRGEPRLTGLPDFSGTMLQDAENVGRMSQFFAHAIEWKFVAPSEDMTSSSGVWELAMRKLRGEGGPRPVTLVALRTILQALAVEADMRKERAGGAGDVAAPAAAAVDPPRAGATPPKGPADRDNAAAQNSAATRGEGAAVQDRGDRRSVPGRLGPTDATIRVAPLTAAPGQQDGGRKDGTTRISAVTDSLRPPNAATEPEIELPAFVRNSQSAPPMQAAAVGLGAAADGYGVNGQETDDGNVDPKEWADDEDPRGSYVRPLMWGIGAVIVVGLFIAAMGLAGRPHVQASPGNTSPAASPGGRPAHGGAQHNPHGGGTASAAGGGGKTKASQASSGHGGSLSSVVGMAPPAAVSALTARGYSPANISVTAVSSNGGNGRVATAAKTAAGVLLTVDIASGQDMVPNLSGLSSVQAGDLLLADHFHFQYTLQAHKGTPQGTVFAQQPAPYTVTSQWSTVSFTAGRA